MKRFLALFLSLPMVCLGQDPVPPLTVMTVHGGKITLACAIAPRPESVNMAQARSSWLSEIKVSLALPEGLAAWVPFGSSGLGLSARVPRGASGIELTVRLAPATEILRWAAVNEWLTAPSASTRNWVSGAKARIAEEVARDGYTLEVLERAETQMQLVTQ